MCLGTEGARFKLDGVAVEYRAVTKGSQPVVVGSIMLPSQTGLKMAERESDQKPVESRPAIGKRETRVRGPVVARSSINESALPARFQVTAGTGLAARQSARSVVAPLRTSRVVTRGR